MVWSKRGLSIRVLARVSRLSLAVSTDIAFALRGLEQEGERKQAESESRRQSAIPSAVISSPQETVALLDTEGKILSMNLSGVKRFDMTPEGIVGKNANAPVPEPASSKRKRIVAEVMQTRQPSHFEDRRRNAQFRNRVYAFNDPQIGELLDVAVFSEDITDHRKAEEALALQARIAGIFVTVPDDGMFNEVLKVILEVTHSRFGVFGYLDEAGALVVPTMTRQIWDKCQVPDKTIRFPREKWGDDSWCRSLREKRTIHSNEPSTHVAAGHVVIQRHIAAPILMQGEVIGIFEVANKETDYTEADIRTLEAIARHVSPVLNARLHREWTQETLRERTKELICLYVVSRDIQEDLPIDELCRRAVEHLIAAMQFPEITVPVIELNGKRFTSENYTAGLTPLLDAEIGMEGGAPGHLRVYCAAERPFLTPEEQRLVKGVAEVLGTWFSHRRAGEEIKSLSKFPSENPQPVLRIARDGTLLYINEAGLSQLPQWHLQVGRASPPMLREAVFQSMDNGSVQTLDLEHGERTYSFFVAPIVAAGYTNLYGRDITERKQAEKRTQMFSQEIIAAREEERKEVSSVLHGDVGSLAVGISAHLGAIEEDLRSGKPGEVLKWMKRTRKLFDESLARLKGLAVQLRPPELDVLGLGAALRQHFSQVTKQRSTRVHFRETLGRRRVSEDTTAILFRVAQEALTNAITHGNAKRVDVDLSASRKEVTLIVRDNGKGFDPSEEGERVRSQMGLRVMREMAAAAGGDFTVDSGRGKGTTVRVSLPFKTAALGPGNVTVREETVSRGKTTRSAGRGSRAQKGAGA